VSTNLLRPSWGQLDSHELRILLDNRIGGPGQFENRAADPSNFCLPQAGPTCRVVLRYCDHRIVSVEPGAAFDQAQWEAIADEIETAVLAGPVKTGREYSFSSYRVEGFWRGPRSDVQILPPHAESPRAPCELAEHPFILEFPLRETKLWPLTNHRRMREHRDLTLLLNVLLAGRTNLQPRRAPHCWGTSFGGGGKTQWVQNSYFGKLDQPVQDTLSSPEGPPLPEIDAAQYFTAVRGIDGQGLRLPGDLDDSICCYQALLPTRREDFNRATYWLDMASRQWHVSVSASFAALVSVIESLINTSGLGSAKRFRSFLQTHAPGATHAARRNQMYDLRSGILHGSRLMRIDTDIALGWDPPWWDERELHEEMWTVTRVAVRNWLRNPSP
jgi:hypothetical protein